MFSLLYYCNNYLKFKHGGFYNVVCDYRTIKDMLTKQGQGHFRQVASITRLRHDGAGVAIARPKIFECAHARLYTIILIIYQQYIWGLDPMISGSAGRHANHCSVAPAW